MLGFLFYRLRLLLTYLCEAAAVNVVFANYSVPPPLILSKTVNGEMKKGSAMARAPSAHFSVCIWTLSGKALVFTGCYGELVSRVASRLSSATGCSSLYLSYFTLKPAGRGRCKAPSDCVYMRSGLCAGEGRRGEGRRGDPSCAGMCWPTRDKC